MTEAQLATIKKRLELEMSSQRTEDYKEVGNKYYHGIRTGEVGVQLRKLVRPDYDEKDDIIRVAGWFHDFRNGRSNHMKAGAEDTRIMITGLCSQEEVDEICFIISVHDERSHYHKYPFEALIVQDADQIDHAGCYEVFDHFGYRRSINDTINKIAADIHNCHDEPLPWSVKKYNFDESRVIHIDRSKYVNSFAERFYSEMNGNIFNAEELMADFHANPSKYIK